MLFLAPLLLVVGVGLLSMVLLLLLLLALMFLLLLLLVVVVVVGVVLFGCCGSGLLFSGVVFAEFCFVLMLL